VKNRWNSASHARARRARLHEVPPPEWEESYETAVVAEYCRTFQVRAVPHTRDSDARVCDTRKSRAWSSGLSMTFLK
jgi:hypothetical protein